MISKSMTSNRKAEMQRRIFCLFTVSVVMALLASSCIMYRPLNADIPLLEEPGELRVDASASVAMPILPVPSGNATVTYSPWNHVAMQVAGGITDGSNYITRGAVGFYCHPGWQSVLEVYAGAGGGHGLYKSSHSEDGNMRRRFGDYGFGFTQLNWGWNNIAGLNLDFGIGLRAGVMNSSFIYEHTDTAGVVTIKDNFKGNCLMLEPQMMLRFGGEHWKICFNVAYTALPGWPEDNPNFNHERFSVGIGVNYLLFGRNRKE